MCGIVGAVSLAPIESKLIEEMRDLMVHRGPDHGGIWRSADARVCLGHRRLAIIDLSAEANQPFSSHDGRFVITWNGEIYNFQELRAELTADGTEFRTRSDTEVLLESYRRWGEACLGRLSGMFAFGIWDAVGRRLFCARDRVGEKPFYYTVVEGGFVFASEIKALLLWPGFQKKIDCNALIDYLSFGFVADPKSIWEGCRKLPPGHSMSVYLNADGSVALTEPAAYWDLEFDPDYSVSNWAPPILETLQAASKEMAFADVAVGTFLSGGVDSSSITAALTRAGCNVKTFTVGFNHQAYDERSWARQVAELYGTSHTERVVEAEDVSADFQKMLWHYDEPFNDYSYLPTLHVCREARKVITVALSGDGGDEIFAGYRKYQRLGFRRDLERLVPRRLSRALGIGASLLFREPSRFRRTISQYGMQAAEALTDMLMLGFSHSSLRGAVRGPLAEALRHYTPMDTVKGLLQKAPPEKVGLINSMRYLDLKLTLAGDILVKVDRASMAVSLEVRPVYLHRAMISLAAKIPSELLADRRHSKEVLKSSLRTWLPDGLLYRKKQGFAMPLPQWINGSLRQMFAPNRAANHLDDLLDADLLERMTKTHAARGADLTSLMHSLFFLNQWVAKWA